MKTIIKNGLVVRVGSPTAKKENVYMEDGHIVQPFGDGGGEEEINLIDAEGCYVLPGLIDLHVHFRDPGQTYKEDLLSGSRAAVKGGYTTVCCMPNTDPPIDNEEILQDIKQRSRDINLVNIYPSCAMTINQSGQELTHIDTMKRSLAVTEDGKSLLDDNLMEELCHTAKENHILIMDHPEDIHVKEGSGSPRSEESIVERDINLAEKTGARIHLQHISTEKSVELIRTAKQKGLPITAEVTPHHIALTKDEEKDHGTDAKMNPPLRTEKDRLALIEGLVDGTIDIIATDHAPHSQEDKAQPFHKAPFGITGLETGFAVSYTVLVKGGHMTIGQLAEKMSTLPARISGVKRGCIKEGEVADLTIVEVNNEYVIDRNDFVSKGKNTPFHGMKVLGNVKCTIKDGEIKYDR